MQSYREYFEAEMRSLQELAQEFSEAYPEQAAMLNLNTIKDRDPYVERLLEGMAFLTSQIRHRLDDSIPEISQSLLEHVMPVLIRPYPSHAIVEISGSSQLKEPCLIEAEHSLKAVNRGPKNATCKFKTTHPVNVNPIRVQAVYNEEKLGGGSVINVVLEKHVQASWENINLSELKFYANADWQLAYTLVHSLTDLGSRIQVKAEGKKVFHLARPLSFRISHMSAKDSLLPYNGRSRSAFSVIHDYFCAREKYLFVDLDGLEQLHISDSISQINIIIDTSVNLPVDTRLTSANLKLHCTPVINLYQEDAEPITIDHTRSEYRVNPDRQIADFSSIYSVDSVSSRDQLTGETYSYFPLHSMRYRGKEDRVYSTHQRVAGLDGRITYLSVNLPSKPEIVSIEASVTNNQYPRRYLDLGSINTLESQFSRIISVENITRPSKAFSAPDIQDYQWQLVSLLSLNLTTLESVDTIQHLLSLFDWTEQLENQRKIESISGIQTRITHRLKRGVLFQGMEIQVELNEQGFSGPSDLFLFGAMLHSFFSAFANMTEFVQTKIVRLPSYKEWIWSPTFGKKSLF